MDAESLDYHVGTFTCRGMENGKLKTNQDYAAYAQPFSQLAGSALFCVCDGHGMHGDGVSQEVLNSLIFELEEQSDDLVDSTGATLAEAFMAVNKHLQLMQAEPELEVNALESGACAVAAYLMGNTLWVAAVGDCRAILGVRQHGKVVSYVLNHEHKVDEPVEQDRIESTGAWVRPQYAHPDDGCMMPAKLYQKEGQPGLGPGLSVARAFGDLNATALGIIAHPCVATVELGPQDEFLVLATDGVWEFLENDVVIEIVKKPHDAGKPAY